MAKVTILIALSYMLTLVSSVRVVHAPGTRGRDDKKFKEMEAEPRHFPHSSVTKHTSAHTRLPQKGVFGKVVQVKYHHNSYWPLDYSVNSVTNSSSNLQKYRRGTSAFLAKIRALYG